MNKGVAGVAEATVWAEGIAVIGGLVLIRAELKHLSLSLLRTALIAPKKWVDLLAINRDIMIRTLCLIFAFAWFTNQGAAISDDVLAANLVLMQFVSFAAFFIDGYANAAEVLIGQARGARNSEQTRSIIRLVSQPVGQPAGDHSALYPGHPVDNPFAERQSKCGQHCAQHLRVCSNCPAHIKQRLSTGWSIYRRFELTNHA